MQSVADQVASLKELVQKSLANGGSAGSVNSALGEIDPETQETSQRCM